MGYGRAALACGTCVLVPAEAVAKGLNIPTLNHSRYGVQRPNDRRPHPCPTRPPRSRR